MYFSSMNLGRSVSFLTLLLLLVLLPGRAQSLEAIADSIRQLPNDTNKVKNWSKLASAFIQTNLDSAKAFADSTLFLATRLDFPKGIALGNEKLGTVSNYKGNFQNAVDYFQKSLSYHEAVGNNRSAAIILANMGLCKRNLGDYDEAMSFYFESLNRREAIGDSNGIAFSLKSIGETFAIQNDYAKAETYFKQSLDAFKKLGNIPMEHTMALNLGGFYREQGKLDTAEKYIQKGLSYFEENGPKYELARAYYNLAGLHLARNELSASASSYLTSKAYYEELGFTMRVAGTLISLSKVSQRQGEIDQAIQYATEALDLAKSLETKSQISRALLQLSDIYKDNNQYKEAYAYYVDFKAMDDSIRNEEKQRTILELEEKYQSRLSEQRLNELSAANEMNELKLQQQERQQLVLIVFAALVLLVAGLVFNQYRVKQKTSELLLEKNNIIQQSLTEKEVLLREIHHRVKNNLQFISSLLNLQSRHVKDPEINTVLQESKNRVNSMSLIHQRLYQEDNLTGVDMDAYIHKLTESLLYAYKVDRHKVQTTIKVEDICLEVDSAIPIALILNELLTNVFKYAFIEREEGVLRIELIHKGNALQLLVADDGVGITSKDPTERKSFGYNLIHSLLQKVGGEMQVLSDKGTQVIIDITKYKTA